METFPLLFPSATEVVEYGFLHIGWKVYFSFSKAGFVFFKGFDAPHRENKDLDIFFQIFLRFFPEFVLFRNRSTTLFPTLR